MNKIRDICGQRFGRLVAIEIVGADKRGNKLWKCTCDCGAETVVRGKNLNATGTQSCGCLAKERASETHRIDLTNKRFGRLLVIKQIGKRGKNTLLWECLCDCGNNTIAQAGNLRNSSSTSCGCLQKELAAARAKTLVGENSPSWNPNLSDEDRLDRREITGYKEWKQQVRTAANFTCVKCRIRKGPFDCHHIEGYRANKKLRLEPSNGACFCAACHTNFHKLYGYGNNTRVQFEEYLKPSQPEIQQE